MAAVSAMRVTLVMIVHMDAQPQRAACYLAQDMGYAHLLAGIRHASVSQDGLVDHVQTGHVSRKALYSWAKSTSANVRQVILAAHVKTKSKIMRGILRSR